MGELRPNLKRRLVRKKVDIERSKSPIQTFLYIGTGLQISDISKDLRQCKCQRPVQKRHFNQDFKKHFWSFIITAHQVPLQRKMQKRNRNRKKEDAIMRQRQNANDIQMAKTLILPKERKGYVTQYRDI